MALATGLLFPFSPLAAVVLLPTAALVAVRIPVFPAAWPAGLMLAWLLWLPFSLSWSIAPGLSLDYLGGLLCLPLAWLVGVANREQLNRWLEVLLPGLLLVLVLWGWQQGPETYTTKPQGPFNDPNTYAAVLNLLALPLLAGYLAQDMHVAPPLRRIGMLALLGITGFVAMLVSSRGATLALALVVPILLWHGRHSPDFSRKLWSLGVISVAAYSAALAATSELWAGKAVIYRLAQTVQHGDQSRLDLMYSAWLMIQEHPWLGSGLGTFRLLYAQFRMPSEFGTAGGWVHNDYLQLWQEAGLPMLLILLGITFWVARMLTSAMSAQAVDLRRLGYLAGLAAILIHALVNFLFYFSLIGLLFGLYLARVGDVSYQSAPAKPMPRAGRMMIVAYILTMIYLLMGQVAINGLLNDSRQIRSLFSALELPYQKYELAYWLSVVAPFHPTPHMVMAKETADTALWTGDPGGAMVHDALQRYRQALRLAPCYMPIYSAYLDLLSRADSHARKNSGDIINTALSCNRHHGLTYFYAGQLAASRSDGDAVRYWQTGLRESRHLAERIMLAAAILSRSMPENRIAISTVAEDVARAISAMESNPMLRPDQIFWAETQHKLYAMAGQRYLALVPPPKIADQRQASGKRQL